MRKGIVILGNCLQVVAREDDNVLHHSVLDILKEPGILSDSICCALEPLLVCGSLSCCQHFYKAVPAKPDSAAKVVRPGKMSIERCGIKLGQNVDLADSTVDTVAHGDIYEPVCSANGNSRLCSLFC